MLEFLVSFRVGVEGTRRESCAEAIQGRFPVCLRTPPDQLNESLLVEVEEEAVIEKRGRGVSSEEGEGGVDVTSLERATGQADEDARAVRRGGGCGRG